MFPDPRGHRPRFEFPGSTGAGPQQYSLCFSSPFKRSFCQDYRGLAHSATNSCPSVLMLFFQEVFNFYRKLQYSLGLEMLRHDGFRSWVLHPPWFLSHQLFMTSEPLIHQFLRVFHFCFYHVELEKKGGHLCDALVKVKLSNCVCKPDKALYNLHTKAKFKAKTLNLYKIYK